jgi:uncharacterized GH25 family protein
MRPAIPFLLAVTMLSSSIGYGRAHYTMLLPERHSVKRGDEVTLLCQWGHPFEHQLFDAPAPEQLVVFAPDGQTTDLTKQLEKVVVVPTTGAKQVTAYRLRFKALERGDYIFMMNGAPIWMPEDELFYQDSVKVVLHVQAQKGWDAAVGSAFQLTPLTRPYGLQPGTVFQASIGPPSVSNTGRLVEIEHYNAKAPGSLPPDEHITRTVKTDPNGVATCTLTEPGWWCITTLRDGGKRAHESKAYPVRQRATLWVFVDELRK